MKNKRFFPESELIINADGSCFHLHLRPEQMADRIILVGDPARVDTVAAHFNSRECEVSSREFHTITGTYKGKRITCQSHGIGCDNIDIVVNELDTLANIDYTTRQEREEHRMLTLVRIGTCGGLQPETPTGSFVASVKSIGFDGLLNYYADRDKVCDLQLEEAFKQHMQWDPKKGSPYVAVADPELTNRRHGLAPWPSRYDLLYGHRQPLCPEDEHRVQKLHRHAHRESARQNMIVRNIFVGILAILFLVLAVIFLMGKGDKLIAGYNTASEEDRAKVNIKRLRFLMAILSVIAAGYVSILPFIGNNPQNQMGALFIFFAITIIFIILANTWAKKK